jgi:hypothetical protein
MHCPYCHKGTSHEACWKKNGFHIQWNFLFTDPEIRTYTVTGGWQRKAVTINGRQLTGAVYHQFMQIDPPWEWDDTQANFEEELAAWDQQFSWGDETVGTFFLSLALQRWITMRMSLMQQYFYPVLVDLPQKDFSLSFQSANLFHAWQELEGNFAREFTEFLEARGFEAMEG